MAVISQKGNKELDKYCLFHAFVLYLESETVITFCHTREIVTKCATEFVRLLNSGGKIFQ